MSKPSNENSTEKGRWQFFIWILKYTFWQHQRELTNKGKWWKSGGIYCPPPIFTEQPKCKNVLTKTQSDALDILKNINQSKK